MKKRIVKLNENDIERLVNRIIKEEDKVSSGQLGKSTQQAGKDIKKMGLTPKEREVFGTAVDMLKNFFAQSGNQATGKALQLFNKFKESLKDIKGEPVDSQESGEQRKKFGSIGDRANKEVGGTDEYDINPEDIER